MMFDLPDEPDFGEEASIQQRNDTFVGENSIIQMIEDSAPRKAEGRNENTLIFDGQSLLMDGGNMNLDSFMRDEDRPLKQGDKMITSLEESEILQNPNQTSN